MKETMFSLPMIGSADAGESLRVDGEWHGFRPTGPLTDGNATSAPEPDLPQGEYGIPALNESQPVPSFAVDGAIRIVELLAPAGGPDAAYAAFHYGADAIYLGLKKFSARAEAENFTLSELDEVIAYAHSLAPPRRVFVTINTLIRQDELPELVETLSALADARVDAIIIQDLGVYYIARRYFPKLEIHASTQLAVHNRAGAEMLRHLGFARVVLARELTFEEVNDITMSSGIETEVFIHGALCYSYSGLCLFSSQTLGRSGNRGKCAYSCRDSYEVSGAPATLRDGSAVKRDPRHGFPFSMKDLALPDHLPALRAAGVSCFKIEGRKKSPLYVATTTDYYRKLLDGRLKPDERALQEADLQTVFSRPWTRLFVQSHKDKEVADRDTVGHRGTPIGTVQAVTEVAGRERLRFRTRRALELHDGLQIDLPILGKPFGFAVDRLWVAPKKPRARAKEVFETPSVADVEVELPVEHPEIPIGAKVYCSSSQAVKRTYRHARPKPGSFRVRMDLDIHIWLTANELVVEGSVSPACNLEQTITVRQSIQGPFDNARDAAAMRSTMRSVFEKLGDTCFQLRTFAFEENQSCFIPVSRLNHLRRKLVAELDDQLSRTCCRHVDRIKSEVGPRTASALSSRQFAWSLKIDRIGFVDDFTADDWQSIDEIVIDIARDHPSTLFAQLDRLASCVGPERIRLALPALTRKWEEHGLLLKVQKLRAAGWNKWEAANLSAWRFLGIDSDGRHKSGLDISTDWSVYAINRAAILQLLSMGVSRFALSPEDGRKNMASLLREFGSQAVVIVYQDTPQFLAESCAYANLIGGCPGKTNCRFEQMEMVSSHGEKALALDYHCRTIVLNEAPFSLASQLDELVGIGAQLLRADFVYRPYIAAQVRQIWRQVRAGKTIMQAHSANFERGIL